MEELHNEFLSPSSQYTSSIIPNMSELGRSSTSTPSTEETEVTGVIVDLPAESPYPIAGSSKDDVILVNIVEPESAPMISLNSSTNTMYLTDLLELNCWPHSDYVREVSLLDTEIPSEEVLDPTMYPMFSMYFVNNPGANMFEEEVLYAVDAAASVCKPVKDKFSGENPDKNKPDVYSNTDEIFDLQVLV